MPAYFDTGYSVRQPMWHGEGTVLNDYPTDWLDARSKAGLLWEPETRRGGYMEPVKCFVCDVPSGGYHADSCTDTGAVQLGERFVGGENLQVVIRNDTGAVLGPVSDRFGLVTHEAMGGIIEAILGAGAKFETAGSCGKIAGQQVWALAYLPNDGQAIAGDDTETFPFMAILNAHDGSAACKVVMTSVRVVCWNTYQAAMADGSRHGREYTIRHTGDVSTRIEDVKAALSGARKHQAEWVETANDLASLLVTDETWEKFVNSFIAPIGGGLVSDRVAANIEASRATLNGLYMSETCAAHRGTALGAIDAAVEYLDHKRGWRNRDTYLGRTLLRPEPLKAKAYSMIRELVSA